MPGRTDCHFPPQQGAGSLAQGRCRHKVKLRARSSECCESRAIARASSAYCRAWTRSRSPADSRKSAIRATSGLPARTKPHALDGDATCSLLSRNISCDRPVRAAQHIANHESPRTTKLYDRRQDEISLDEVEKILI